MKISIVDDGFGLSYTTEVEELNNGDTRYYSMEIHSRDKIILKEVIGSSVENTYEYYGLVYFLYHMGRDEEI